MFKNVRKYHTHLLRFRRWSRKSYAIFCSMGRCVVIGHLKNQIADSSLSKDTFLKEDCKTIIRSLLPRETEEDPIPLSELLAIILPNAGTVETAPGILHIHMFITESAPRYRSCICNGEHFFYSCIL